MIKKIIREAKKNRQKIVFPESNEERILKACHILAKKKIAQPILIGKEEEIYERLKKMSLKKTILKEVIIINPDRKKFAEDLYNIRKSKGLTREKAKELVKDNNYIGALMVQQKFADGCIAGATCPTAKTLRPALQVIGANRLASSYFLMIKNEEQILFSDCAFNMNPTAKQLCEIAISTNESAKELGLKPKIAMLSFSTHGSANNESTEKIREAIKLVKRKRKDIIIDGEIQFDAAYVPEIAKKKCKPNLLKGRANVFIFPNLDAGNIGYKLVERLGKYKAIGPIIQGLKMPMNDLSRGCDVEDIVEIAAITAVEAMNKKKQIQNKKN